MSAGAVAGQSLSLVVGGAGLGLGIAFGGLLYFERDRAGGLQERLLAETLSHYGTVAQLGTCQAMRDGLREGREIDNAIPDDLGDFMLNPDWMLRLDQPSPD